MVAWLFPGQGSQRQGMGEQLLGRYPRLVEAADRELGYSVSQLCRCDSGGQLRDTAYAQPALFVVSALAYLDRAERDGPPKFLAGHSLGEYVALLAAGCFDFATGVRLVRRRGELMARASGGGMLAVIGLPAAEVTAAAADGGHDDVDVANLNAADQVVLSGPVRSLEAVAGEIAARGRGRCVPLNVSAAFHSRYMADAAGQLACFLDQCELADPQATVISNVTARPYQPGTVRELLVRQVSEPVRWADSMRYLLDQGVTEVAELGPGTVLTGLWRAARRGYPAAAARGTAATRPAGAAGRGQPARIMPLPQVSAQALGSSDFRRDYGLRYAYLAGAMYHGIASAELVLRMGEAGLMGFFGAGGLSLAELSDAISLFTGRLGPGGRYGMNLLCTLDDPGYERDVVELYLRRGVRYVEAAAYPQLTVPLLRWRFSGAHRDGAGRPVAVNHVLAKVSRPEVAAAFMRPPPAPLLARLAGQGLLSPAEADAASSLPVSDDICVESDSGGHTDGGVALTLMPVIQRLRDTVMAEHRYPSRIRVGAAGGLGAPEGLAAAFILGADFVVTGSVNQCTPQAGTSDAVKELLCGLDVQDTTYAPAGDMFELGARVQVVRKGTLFAARANKLYQLYRQYRCLEDIDEQARRVVQRDYFGRSFADIWAETAGYLARRHPDEAARAQRDPRRRMALVFRWYFRMSTDAAMRGDPDQRVNYQVHCGPAMGAFNRWVRGTELEDWRRRDVDVIAERLMTATAELLGERLTAMAVPAALSAQH
ncbi:MAG TPA: ACP S-malonyltransferase [Streptosporangiaceae bacterium]|jgi:trans-AT polyketide synthase/acyltransferase/oxidoreductase domain-containing protein